MQVKDRQLAERVHGGAGGAWIARRNGGEHRLMGGRPRAAMAPRGRVEPTVQVRVARVRRP
jgi:hypothetical protein